MLLVLSCKTGQESKVIDTNPVDSLKQHSVIDSDYITTRNKYVRYFHSLDLNSVDWENQNDSTLVKEETALLELESKLKQLLINTKFFEKEKSKINLVTLFDDYGFGLMDGLVTDIDTLKAYCTTIDIFSDFFKKVKLNDFNNLSTEELELILNKALYYDAHITIFYNQKFSTENGNIKYGLLSYLGQDLGITPWILYTISKFDNKIYIIEQRVKVELDLIPECKLLLDNILSKSDKYLDKYYQTGELDTSIDLNSMKFEDFAYKKYRDCFQEKFPQSDKYENVEKQMKQLESILE